MVDFFDKLYTSIQNNNQFLTKIRFYSFIRFNVRAIANLLLPLYFRMTNKNDQYSLSNSGNNQMIIVSLTSFPKRINRLWLVVESILRQTKKADMIILWLSISQFPNRDQSLPQHLVNMRKRGLDIRYIEEDIRSHKKYYYVFQQYPNDHIITIDDDIFYRSTMIEDLWNYHLKYPNSIIAQFSKTMKWSLTGEIGPYQSWVNIWNKTIESEQSFFGSGGGTFFPPKSLHDNVLNKQLFLKLCPLADDIWLNAMARLKGTKVVKTFYSSQFLPVMNKNDITLASINNGDNFNDKQIKAVRNFYLEQGLNPF